MALATLFKMIFRFNAIPIKIPPCLIWQTDPKRHINTRNPAHPKLLKENNFGQLTFADFKTNHKATIIKIVWSWHKDRHRNQENMVDSLELKLHFIIN